VHNGRRAQTRARKQGAGHNRGQPLSLRNCRRVSTGPFPGCEKSEKNHQNFRKLMGDSALRANEYDSLLDRRYA
jgi:hypothetical protein